VKKSGKEWKRVEKERGVKELEGEESKKRGLEFEEKRGRRWRSLEKRGS
jgi:hypothetical protein